MRGSLRLGKLFGIEIGIHYSWILIFLLVSATLALGILPATVPDIGAARAWLAAMLAAVLLFLSVLAHEIAHSLVAKARGIPVRSITLFILGGVSSIEEEAKKPAIEFWMALVGPVTSLILGVLFWLAYSALTSGPQSIAFPANHYKNPMTAVLHYMAYVNLILGAFNLLPGFPLDGGRVLRSALWAASGNLVRATDIATAIGRLFGWTLIAIGVLNVLGFGVLIFPAGLGGIWIGIIGWFLSNAADASRQEVTLQQRLGGAKVKDAMVKYETIGPRATVDELVKGFMNQKYRRAAPVCDEGKTVGIVTISDVKKVSQDKWPTTSVEAVMTKAPLYTVKPEDDLNQALRLIAHHDLNQVLVMDEGQCTGLLSRAEIIHFLQLSQELKIKNTDKRGR